MMYSDEEPMRSRSNVLRPVAPTIIKSAPSLSGISRAKRVLGLPNSMTCLTLVKPLSRACFS